MDGGSTHWRIASRACDSELISLLCCDAESLGPKDDTGESSSRNTSAEKRNEGSTCSGIDATYLRVCLEREQCVAQCEALRGPSKEHLRD
jgi:hypothetical protein